MRCPSLNQLPPPPSGKTGWPWTVENSQMPDTMSDGSPWLKISIVTPSFNQGEFIEETVRSVLLQGYPNLEYIIIDGGSTDSSVEIIRKYEPWLDYWVSEPDKGQAEAINKGFKRIDGDFTTWLNSDDLFTRKALEVVANQIVILEKREDLFVLIGGAGFVDRDSMVRARTPSNSSREQRVTKIELSPLDVLSGRKPGYQPSTFWTRDVLRHVGYIREDFHYAFDTDYWIRMVLSGASFYYISHELALSRVHPESKTVSQAENWMPELRRLANQYLGGKSNLDWWRYYISRLIWHRSLARVHRAWRVSKYDRKLAFRFLLKSAFTLLPAYLVKPRDFLAAIYRIVFGWGNKYPYA